MLPFLSLDSATSPIAGEAKDLEDVLETHTLVYTVEGATPLAFELRFEGSHDGSNWFGLEGINVTNGGPGTGTLIRTGVLARYVRAHLEEVGVGFTSVTATVASI